MPRSKWICWNPYNKVVQDHRDGTIHPRLTAYEREMRGLPKWNPATAEDEAREPPIE